MEQKYTENNSKFFFEAIGDDAQVKTVTEMFFFSLSFPAV